MKKLILLVLFVIFCSTQINALSCADCPDGTICCDHVLDGVLQEDSNCEMDIPECATITSDVTTERWDGHEETISCILSIDETPCVPEFSTYGVIGAVVIIVAALGWFFYKRKKK